MRSRLHVLVENCLSPCFASKLDFHNFEAVAAFKVLSFAQHVAKYFLSAHLEQIRGDSVLCLSENMPIG